eukprot:COSAG01_NODE_1311_length_10774_cov_18.218299_14_plen_56_part_00
MQRAVLLVDADQGDTGLHEHVSSCDVRQSPERLCRTAHSVGTQGKAVIHNTQWVS